MLFVLPQCLHPSRSGTRLNRSTKWKRYSTKRAQTKRMSPHLKRLPLLRIQPLRTNHPHLQNVKKSSPIHKKSPVTQKNKSLQNYSYWSYWSYFELTTAIFFLHKQFFYIFNIIKECFAPISFKFFVLHITTLDKFTCIFCSRPLWCCFDIARTTNKLIFATLS